jgi:bifunctional polynucleotide phosphatase/kinase
VNRRVWGCQVLTSIAVHPFFAKPAVDPNAPFKWHPSFGVKRTCLHGTNLESRIIYNPKIAAFDLDGTIIESSYGKGSKKPSSGTAYQWWNKCVPPKLEEAFKAGYVLIYLSC